MPGYNAELARFAGLDAQVVGISVDSVYSHMAWQKHDTGVLSFPLGSDFYPHGEVAKKYGILRESLMPLPGINERAVFAINKQGVIVFAKVYDLGELPPNEEVFAALANVQATTTAAK